MDLAIKGKTSSCPDEGSFSYVICCLPAEPEDGDTYLHGKMVLLQPHELKLEILMRFQHSRSYASVYQLNCNCVPQKPLMNVFSEVKPCQYQ